MTVEKFCIVNCGGKQYWLTPGKPVWLDLQKVEGHTMELPILLHSEGKTGFVKVKVSNPHFKGKKILVQKYKRRKGYIKKYGHRTCYTSIIWEANSGN